MGTRWHLNHLWFWYHTLATNVDLDAKEFHVGGAVEGVANLREIGWRGRLRRGGLVSATTCGLAWSKHGPVAAKFGQVLGTTGLASTKSGLQ